MANELVEQIVVSAVQQAYDAWALEHPTLASVIDRIELTQQTLESLRQSQEYRQAIEAYHRSRGEMELLNRLIDLAGPLVRTVLSS